MDRKQKNIKCSYNKMFTLFFTILALFIFSCSSYEKEVEELKARYIVLENTTLLSKDRVIELMGENNLIEPHNTGDVYIWRDSNGIDRVKVKFAPIVDRVISVTWQDVE